MSYVCSYKSQSQAEFSREPRKCPVWYDYTSEVKDIAASSSLTDFDRAWILFSMQWKSLQGFSKEKWHNTSTFSKKLLYLLGRENGG